MKMLILLCTLILLLCATLSFAQDKSLSTIKYSIGGWGINGHGNHRAVVNVNSPSDAVVANIQWRRRDENPHSKAIVVENEKGEKINNVVVLENTKEFGKIVFEAKTAGKYFIYYLPFDQPSGSFIPKTIYYTPKDTASAEFKGKASGNLPQAEVLEIQARSEFDSMFPMELPATKAEASSLLEKNKDKSYLVFAEDRIYPIKMQDEIPYKWIVSGEVTDFVGKANPNEIYAFQIGIDALKEIKNLKLTFSDFKGKSTISASEFHCINLGGDDYLGRPFTKTLNIKQGKVQALWTYVQFPKDASGTYAGTVKISGDNIPERVVNIKIDVSGDILADGGVSDLWRYSRLAWLDSNLAVNDELVAPFTPIKVVGSTANILNRSIDFSNMGIPTQIKSYGVSILNSPVSFDVLIGGKKVTFTPDNKKVIVSDDGAYEVEYTSKSSDLKLYIKPRLEFDGTLDFDVKLTALNNVSIDDVKLSIPVNSSIAKYFMGMSLRGGFAPEKAEWKWTSSNIGNMVWVGDYNAGLQLKLKTENDLYKVAPPLPRSEFPKGWWNNDNGILETQKVGSIYYITAKSGARTLAKDESVSYNFRLMVTPFKPLDNRHYDERIGGPGQAGTNILHVHHATPQNPYINYPFLTINELKGLQDSLKNIETMDGGGVTYNGLESALTADKGTIHVWVESTFDWSKQPENVEFLQVNFKENQTLGFYWNRDTKSMRAYSFKINNGQYIFNLVADASIAAGSWKAGDKHILSISWGDSLKCFMDGNKVLDDPYKGAVIVKTLLDNIKIAGGFAVDAVKVDSTSFDGGQVTLDPAPSTILVDTFDNIKSNKSTPKYVNLDTAFNGVITSDKLAGLNSDKGSVSLRVENIFDWANTPVNQEMLSINFKGDQCLGFYWNRDIKTMRAYSHKKIGDDYKHPVLFDTSIPAGTWKPGDKHTLSISWGDAVRCYLDGNLVGEQAFSGATLEKADVENITLSNGFKYDYIQVNNDVYNGGSLPASYLYASDFKTKSPQSANNAKVFGQIDPSSKIVNGVVYPVMKKSNFDINLYYTCREMTDHVYEIWALRSLGDEVYDETGMIYDANGAAILTGGSGGGHPWLAEHLRSDYVPAWYCNLGEDHCNAIATRYVSRWMNYYVNGMDYIMKHTGINGLYLDGIGYDRQTMKRIARVMQSNDKNYRINYHSGNNYDYENWKSNVLNTTMEHLPYVTSLWIGEMFSYDTPSEYWFTEMSGIPFGLRNEMLNYENGGNQYRGMVYAMTGRMNKSYVPMLKFWDEIGIDKTQMIGYWDNKPVVTTSNKDILATAYKGKGFVIIAVGSWATAEDNINITVNYKALGLNPTSVTYVMPNIESFQEGKTLKSLNNINIKPKEGCIIVIK